MTTSDNIVPATDLPADSLEISKISEDEDVNWETASFFEDVFDDARRGQQLIPGPDTCTPDEARDFRSRLREVGAILFLKETVTRGTISAKKLCTAFDIHLPEFFKDMPDNYCYPLLHVAMSRELERRPRLPEYQTIDDAARLLVSSKNIMVITGAGISTSLGIPDFRSKNTGFYARLQDLGYHEPEQVFDIHNFDDDPAIFYALAGEILPTSSKWSPTHEFIRLLQDKNKLLTNYSQNIDNVESHAGIRRENLIQCHGSWATATCRKCKFQIPGENIFDDIRERRVAHCKQCIRRLQAPIPGLKRKRDSNGNSRGKRNQESDDDDSAYDIPQPGVMKPDITFFGEGLPSEFFDCLRNRDRDLVDLVIVIGTSMKVAPVSEIPQIISTSIPQIYISRDPIHHINFDINLIGDCDLVIAELCRRAGWTIKHPMLPVDQKVDVDLCQNQEASYSIKVRDS